MNPVYKKEVRQYTRAPKTALILFFYNALLALIALFALYLMFYNRGGYVNYADILKVYGILAGIEFVLLLLTVPVLAAGTIAGERERQTLDILLTTKLSAARIVFGKLISAISLMLLLVVSSLPVLSVVFFVGGIKITDLFVLFGLYGITALYVGSIGMAASALCKKTTSAIVTAYGFLFFLMAGSLLAVTAEYLYRLRAAGQAVSFYAWYYGYSGAAPGASVYLLLLNPLFTCLSVLSSQVGTGKAVFAGLYDASPEKAFLFRYWPYISLLLQTALSGLCSLFAAVLLQKRRYRRK